MRESSVDGFLKDCFTVAGTVTARWRRDRQAVYLGCARDTRGMNDDGRIFHKDDIFSDDSVWIKISLATGGR